MSCLVKSSSKPDVAGLSLGDVHPVQQPPVLLQHQAGPQSGQQQGPFAPQAGQQQRPFAPQAGQPQRPPAPQAVQQSTTTCRLMARLFGG